jgi:hypothetical protein
LTNLVVYWSGIDLNNNRVWGYFVDTKIHSASFGNIKTLQIFWGMKNGNLYFQTVSNTREFQKAAKLKVRKYKFMKELKDHLVSEYERNVIVSKLKGVYE